MAKRKSPRSKSKKSKFPTGAVLFLVAIATFLDPQTRAYIVGIVAFMLFIYLLTKWLQRRKLRKSGIREIDQMTGKQFEAYLADLLKRRGYKVLLTQDTRDFGADLIIEKDGERTVVQAKRYNKNVGIRAVQEVFAATKHYNAGFGWVISSAEFTKAAKELAETNEVRLIGREGLIQLVLSTK